MINRFAIPAIIFFGGSLARGDNYMATILYPLMDPGGISIQPRQVTADGTVGNSPSAPSHALLWSPPDGGVTDLNPTELGTGVSSEPFGEFGNQQVGLYGSTDTSGYSHAVLWSGTAASAVDLNPAQLGMFASFAVGTDGTQQVGRGTFGTPSNFTFHALLWTGTAGSAVDLSPTGLGSPSDSLAVGVYGGQEVGGYSTLTTPIHAVLWTGTAASAVDLHPLDPTLKYSDAIATSGSQQVGVARANGLNPEAFLWYGAAASAVNLNPTTLAGINASIADATNGIEQAGYGFDGSASVNDDQALVWSGSANSVVNLHAVLPATGTWNFSDAYGIDVGGNVFGTANGTFDGATGNFAVEWSAVPEPGAGVMVVIAGLVLAGKRMGGGRNRLR
jgi:hypothetical protein